MTRFHVKLLLLSLALAACLSSCLLAAVAVGAAAGVGGAVVYTAEDTVESELPVMPEQAHQLAQETLRSLGSLGEVRTWEERGQKIRGAQGLVGSTNINIRITVGAATSRVSVKGREGIFADRATAEEVLSRMIAATTDAPPE